MKVIHVLRGKTFAPSGGLKLKPITVSGAAITNAKHDVLQTLIQRRHTVALPL